MFYYLMDQANRADLVAGLGLAPEGRVKHGSCHKKKHPYDGKYRLLRNNKKYSHSKILFTFTFSRLKGS